MLVALWNSLTFVHGFLLGLASGLVSFLLLAAFIVRLVFLQDPKEQEKQRSLNIQTQRRKLSKQQQQQKYPSSASTAPSAAQDATPRILEKLAYDITTHPQESADWLNVLLAQTISAYRASLSTPSSETSTSANVFLEQAINASQPNDPENLGFMSIDHINVTQVDFGNKFPVLSGVRVRPSEENNQVRIEAELDYSDNVSLLVDTKVFVNFPTPQFAIIPVSLGVSLVGFSATVSAEISSLSSSSTFSSPTSPTSSSHSPTHLHPPSNSNPSSHTTTTPLTPPQLLTCIHPDFDIQLTSTSLIGAKAKLQDIPKVEQLVISRIRAFIIDKLVWPSKVAVTLPRLFPSQQSLQQHQQADSHTTNNNNAPYPPSSPSLSSSKNRSVSNNIDSDEDEDDQELLNWVDNIDYDNEFNSLMSDLQSDFDSIHEKANNTRRLPPPNSHQKQKRQKLPGEFFNNSSPVLASTPRLNTTSNANTLPTTLISPPTPSTPVVPSSNQNLRKRPTYSNTVPSSSSINTSATANTNNTSTTTKSSTMTTSNTIPQR